jgi:hypothetical protein
MQTRAPLVSEVGRVTYLDPTGFVHQIERRLTPRLGSVAGKVAGLLDNGNDTSSYFFTSLAETLERDYGVEKVVLRTKFTSTRPAEADLIDQMGKEADFLISGVAL